MKFGQILLIILGSIATFIGLAVNKIYQTYVKKNILVQCILYVFWTLLTIRLLYWVAKPFLNIDIKAILDNLGIDVININVGSTAQIICLIVFVIAFIFMSAQAKSWKESLDEQIKKGI